MSAKTFSKSAPDHFDLENAKGRNQNCSAKIRILNSRFHNLDIVTPIVTASGSKSLAPSYLDLSQAQKKTGTVRLPFFTAMLLILKPPAGGTHTVGIRMLG